MAAQASNDSISNTLVVVSSPVDGDEPTVDIIAVHGVDTWGNEAHAENTWTHAETGVNWLRTLLPERLPDARILTFQYNANVVFGTSAAGIKEQATNLLVCLKMIRKEKPGRPIIFIAHSMGGLIVKEALATALYEESAYPMIWAFTYAIFFLAVPHKGSDHASWGQMLANIYRTVTSQPDNSFLETLKRRSKGCEELYARFEPLHQAYRFYSWVESLPCQGLQQVLGIIVDKESATLGLPPSRETVRTANRDHRSICKFSAADDPEWKVLSDHIAEAAREAATACYLTPSIQSRQGMFEVRKHQDTGQSDTTPPLKEANNEARWILGQSHSLFDELQQRRRGEIPRVRQKFSSLDARLLPILSLIAPWVLAVVGWLLQSSIARGPLLQIARQGEAVEDKIIEVEAWTIDQLTEHLRELLSSCHRLEGAVSTLHSGPVQGPVGAQMHDARRLRNELVQRIALTRAELYASHRRRNRAEAERALIQVARTAAADMTDAQLSRAVPQFEKQADEIRAAHQPPEAQEEDDSWWPRSCCVIL